jgi:hypothetical protein
MENSDYNNYSDWNIITIVNFIKENISPMLLLFSVFFIIYIVDYVNNINAILYSIPAVNIQMNNKNQSSNSKKSRMTKK